MDAMYTNDEIMIKFKQFLRTEMDAIFFYLDNIDGCNYQENKEAIDKLVIESVDHQKLLVQGFLSLCNPSPGDMSNDLKLCALKEESGMKDIYGYVLARTDNDRIKEILAKIIAWEEEHEKLAEGLR